MDFGCLTFDPLILEFLADLLTDAAQQPPPQWNAAIDLALDTFYGVGYSAANPGARRIYDVYIARIYQFWPQAIQARVMASVSNYAKTSLTGGNLGDLMGEVQALGDLFEVCATQFGRR